MGNIGLVLLHACHIGKLQNFTENMHVTILKKIYPVLCCEQVESVNLIDTSIAIGHWHLLIIIYSQILWYLKLFQLDFEFEFVNIIII